MSKVSQKAIMVRSKLRKRYYILKTSEAEAEYKKQLDFCTSFLRKSKRFYYGYLIPAKIGDNKNFWKHINPIFSVKVYTNERIYH